jgi:hypothetical protein
VYPLDFARTRSVHQNCCWEAWWLTWLFNLCKGSLACGHDVHHILQLHE